MGEEGQNFDRCIINTSIDTFFSKLHADLAEQKRRRKACHRNFCPTKKCPRIKIFVLGQNISEKFCPRTKFFRTFLSHPNKICLTPKFSGKDEIRAKASLASQITFSSSSTAIGKGRKAGLDNKTNYIRTDRS